MLRQSWWKILAVALLLYALLGGLLLPIPKVKNIMESIRNLHYHVPMWFTMTFLFSLSAYASIRYLSKGIMRNDAWAVELANVASLFGILGLTTGMLWANFTWGDWWSFDPKQNAAAIALLIYGAYFVLRGSITDPKSKARVSAVYNVFAFAALIPLIFILPRLTESLHPGAEGNPGFNTKDVDDQLRMVFYPAVIGWILLGIWFTTQRVRLRILTDKLHEA